ncbi:Rab family GTPase [Legionella quateirensis]|uniref:Ras family GTPase n=1 Tax=Legionella quateirensis TaxID=45072 RepID=A0A378KVY5_9GAMM|nr:Rab family GTPase [Legionella quateirensis]KTD47542.1 Ras family GTPase [Legionella quateirensis]STY18703.1 Ras family GTPase [Legionella quateirensis]
MAASSEVMAQALKKLSVIIVNDTVFDPNFIPLMNIITKDLVQRAGFTHFLIDNHLTLEQLIEVAAANLQKTQDEYGQFLQKAEQKLFEKIDEFAQVEGDYFQKYLLFLESQVVQETEVPVLQFYKGLQADVAARNASTNPPASAELKVRISQLAKTAEKLITDLLLESLEHYKMLQSHGITLISAGDSERSKRILQATQEVLLSGQTNELDARLIEHYDILAKTMLKQERPFIMTVDIVGMGALAITLMKEQPAVYSNYLFVYVYNNPLRDGSAPIPGLLTAPQQELSRLILKNHTTIPINIVPINGEGKTMASVSESVLSRVREAIATLQRVPPVPVSQSTRYAFLQPVRQKEYPRKCALFGDSGVGKSALLRRLKDGTFQETSTLTYGVDMLETHIDKKPVRIWDPSGQSRFLSITSSYFTGNDVILLVFDRTNRESFDNIQLWLKRVQTFCRNPEFTLILIGNKCDLEDKCVVGHEEPAQAIEQWNSSAEGKLLHIHTHIYQPTSAKTGEGMNFLLKQMLKPLLYSTRLESLETSPETPGIGTRP